MYSTVNYSTVQLSIERYNTLQYGKLQYSRVDYSTVHYSTVQYSTVQYSTVYRIDTVSDWRWRLGARPSKLITILLAFVTLSNKYASWVDKKWSWFLIFMKYMVLQNRVKNNHTPLKKKPFFSFFLTKENPIWSALKQDILDEIKQLKGIKPTKKTTISGFFVRLFLTK